MSIRIEVSAGELLDRITILQLKIEHQSDAQKRLVLERELSALMTVQKEAIPSSPELDRLSDDLAAVNRQLWQAEDELRLHERKESFGAEFVAVALSIARLNDQRIVLKRRITELVTGNSQAEEKIYSV